MILESLYRDIVSSFGNLWGFKERGNSLEIITPIATTSHKFISVFLTQRNDEYIVSDGGWIEDGSYGNQFDKTIECYSKIFEHYQNSFNIREVRNGSRSTHYYKKTSNAVSVPSLVFDLSTFISTAISACYVQYADRERDTRESFRRAASDYISSVLPISNTIEFNKYLGTANRRVKFSAIVRKRNNQLVVLNYITGSHLDYFQSNISKTNIIFELADNTIERELIEKKIALVDNTASGYIPEKISIWLNHLVSNTGAKKIDWSNREELAKI